MSKRKYPRCTCGNVNISQSCNNCSQYKIVFLLKNGNDQLKITDASGKKVNPVYWSFIKEEKKTQKELFASMIARARKNDPHLLQASNVVYFYHRNGTNPIDIFKP
jgi:uncharacterized membrane protein YvbJ